MEPQIVPAGPAPVEPETPTSPMGEAGKRAIVIAVLAFLGAAAAYLLTNIGVDIDSVTPGVQTDPYFWHKLAAQGIGAAVAAAGVGRWLMEGVADEKRRQAVVAGDLSKLSTADVGYPVAAKASVAYQRRHRP